MTVSIKPSNQQPQELSAKEKTLYTNLLDLHKNKNLNKNSIHQLEDQPDIDTCITILTLRKKILEFDLRKIKESRLAFIVASLSSLSLVLLGEYWRRQPIYQNIPTLPNPPAGFTIHMGPNMRLFSKISIGAGVILSLITVPIFILSNIPIFLFKKELTIIDNIIQTLQSIKS